MAETGEKPKAFYTIKELAERWVVSDRTVWKEVERGRIRRKLIGSQARFSAEEVARYERMAG